MIRVAKSERRVSTLSTAAGQSQPLRAGFGKPGLGVEAISDRIYRPDRHKICILSNLAHTKKVVQNNHDPSPSQSRTKTLRVPNLLPLKPP